jgi:hypothetical protein
MTYNWSTDTHRLKKDKAKWKKWRLEQLINYGLRGQKLSKSQLVKYWDQLDIDPDKRNYLRFLLWGNQ